MAPQIWLTKLIWPITRFVPMFSTMATPMTERNITGSNHECEVNSKMSVMMSTPITRISATSVAVDCCADAVVTASPSSETWEAPVSSHAWRIRGTASLPLPDSTATWNR